MADVCPCHGEPWAVFAGDQRRRCRIKKRIADLRCITSEKGRARRRKADARYRATHMRIRVGHDQLYLGTYPVTPEQRKVIQDFRQKQREETHGRFDTAVA